VNIEEIIERLVGIIKESMEISPSEVKEGLTDEQVCELQRRVLQMHDQISRIQQAEGGPGIPGNDPYRPN
jgi:hypothetical protein